MPSEITVIRSALEKKKEGQCAIYPFVEGEIGGHRIITAVTGVGVTNGAMTSAIFCHEFSPAAVVVSGTGSRLNPAINCGDTIISTKTIHHGAGTLTDSGMLYRKVRGPLPDMMTHYQYAPDKTLLAQAKKIAKGYEGEAITVDGKTYQPRAYPGVVSASDLFGVSAEKIADLREKLNPDIMEMESAAIAQVCDHLRIPHIVFRAGSNLTQVNPGTAYRKYGQTAAACAARWTVYFLKNLPRA